MIIVLSVISVIVCFIICAIAVLKKRHDLKEAYLAQEARLTKDDQPTEDTNTITTDVESGNVGTVHKANVPSDTGGLIMNDAIAIEKPPTDTNGDLVVIR